jgi:hypothetical protein
MAAVKSERELSLARSRGAFIRQRYRTLCSITGKDIARQAIEAAGHSDREASLHPVGAPIMLWEHRGLTGRC